MTVPAGVLVPGSYIEINNSRAIDPFGTDNFTTVILGEHPVASGGDTEIKYQRILSETDAYNKYGLSPSFEMCRSFINNLEPGSNVELYCVSKPINVIKLVSDTSIVTGGVGESANFQHVGRAASNGDAARRVDLDSRRPNRKQGSIAERSP